MKVICTTSDRYLHILPIFIYLFQKCWPGREVEIVGYKKPGFELPEKFSFHSMGEQVGSNKNFSNDLAKYFLEQDQFFVWLMEDTFLREPVNVSKFHVARVLTLFYKEVGRISLTNQNLNQYTEPFDFLDDPINIRFIATPQKSEYRLSTMPAIWNKDFLLRYLTPDLNPWEFECQDKVEDEFFNIAFEDRDAAPIVHNEGTRRFDIHKMNFEGINPEWVEEMRSLGYLNGMTWN